MLQWKSVVEPNCVGQGRPPEYVMTSLIIATPSKKSSEWQQLKDCTNMGWPASGVIEHA